MSTNNMKRTWPKRKFCVGDPTDLYSIGSRWGFAFGVTQILAFLDTNIRVDSELLI